MKSKEWIDLWEKIYYTIQRMGFVKNIDTLAKTPQRGIVLQLIETALASIQAPRVLEKNFLKNGNLLTIADQQFDLATFERVFVVGFGKGSSGVCKIVETTLGDHLTEGYVIDNVAETFTKLQFTLGTHPLPSQTNIDFTVRVLEKLTGLSEKDLVIVVICGGGSAMFEAPHSADLETLTAVSKALLASGATISDMNVIRKHLSRVKGGGFAKYLYPARVVSLLFSDVPGNDMSVIASGPTVKDSTTMDDVKRTLETFSIDNSMVQIGDFQDTVTDEKYFAHVSNVIMVSNMTALKAMQEKASEMGHKARIYSDTFQSDAKGAGEKLIQETQSGEIVLVGGETTVKVKGTGKGGRNQTLVLAALPFVGENTIIASCDSDGMDMYYFAGALGDWETVATAQKLGLDEKAYLDDDNSYEFFEKVGDGILTDKLESNISDLMIIAKI